MNSRNSSRALIVEGGAIRGIFASGVLDAFLENNYMPFDFAIGVSAGSTNLIGYLCGQHGRSHTIITDYSRRHDFINFARFTQGGHLTDIDWLWRTTTRHLPLNLFKYEQRNIPLYATTTNLETGQAEYIAVSRENITEAMEATCALPVAYRHNPTVSGVAMSDGGIADSIPVIEAYNRGAREITVILSKPLGFHKSETKLPWLIKSMFHDHPKFAEAVLSRAERYNAALDFIANPPADCKLTVIAPKESFQVGRLTRNLEKLEQGYQMGREAGYRLCGLIPCYGDNCYQSERLERAA